ncbi:hypothetical protein [Clostridium botulinum]|uniref:hypothetical protein n=1 Tax=Clostridium botulinum TaxID=1491 RepID=UPI001C9BBA4F|nr:hypothetical protein [Clostridium botulinum]MBY6811870.1 hypothetical protein [Clostridium botulinum]MBY6825352.1 hypothetical protein [Clostridium botulinum]MBY6835705.1 hypothetical protein [Clostridium botulinum]MBY6974395.1 hypothetical protein [Clostridium botulinum]HBJ1652399.1 hypothetical protein [Clostridium botulinum]
MVINLDEVRKHKTYKEKSDVDNRAKALFDFIQSDCKEEKRLLISNGIVKEKMLLKRTYKKIDNFKKQIRKLERDNTLHQSNRKVIIANCERIQELNYIIYKIKDLLLAEARLLIDIYFPLLNDNFSENEIIQILSGNFESVREIRDNPNIYHFDEQNIAISYVINSVEFRSRKGNRNSSICHTCEMPFFNCITNFMLNCENNEG